MSFGKLLATGKSLMGGNGGGRYRMSKNARLPKFISPRNPFAPDNADAPSPRQNGEAGETVNTMSLENVRPPNLALLIAGRLARGLWSLCKKCNPAPLLTGMRRVKRPAIPRFGRAAVQSELSLEKVSVKRNDLADADLEVVARGGGRGLSPGPQTNLLTARVFGAGTK